MDRVKIVEDDTRLTILVPHFLLQRWLLAVVADLFGILLFATVLNTFFSNGVTSFKEFFSIAFLIVFMVVLVWMLLRILVGKEIIEVEEKLIRSKPFVWKVVFFRKYHFDRIRKIRTLSKEQRLIYRGVAASFRLDGLISLDYNGVNIRIGSGLEMDEAILVLKKIREKFPNYPIEI